MSNMPSNAAMRKPKPVSELQRARALGLVGAVKGGPRDVAERHSQYLRAKVRRRARTTPGDGRDGSGGRLTSIASKGSVMSTAKEELTRLIQKQPETSSHEEIVRELAFHVMVQRGLADSDNGRTVSNEEMGRRIRSWRK